MKLWKKVIFSLLFVEFGVLVFQIKVQTARRVVCHIVLFGSFSFRKEKEHNLVSSEPLGSGDTKKEEYSILIE